MKRVGQSMAIGAVSLGWAGTALPEVFEQLRGMGGQCIELNSRVGLHDGLVLDSQTIPRVRSWARESGITIRSIGGYNDFVQREEGALRRERKRLLDACHIASEMGVGIVRAFTGEPKTGVAFEDVRTHIVDSFRQVAQQAEALGVTLAIENHGHAMNDGPQLARLVKDIGVPGVGLTLDTGNFCWAGHDVAQARLDFQAVLPYTLNVHVKDGLWRDGTLAGPEFEFVPAGEGELDLAWVLNQLVAQGYEGPVYSEYEGRGDFLAGTRLSIVYLRSICQAA